MNNEEFMQEAGAVARHLRSLRNDERDIVIPFMSGDLTQGDLYLASSSEYVMRLIDGFILMLESRNIVCVAQLLRAQIGACLRTFALFVAEDQDAFLDRAFKEERINQLKDREGKRMSDARLQELLACFDPKLKDVYETTSGFVHFSMSILPSMGTPADEYHVEFNFGSEPNERINVPLIECGKAFIHYVDLHLQMLQKVIASDDRYANRVKNAEGSTESDSVRG